LRRQSTLIVAITGASGAVYAKRMLEVLLGGGHRVYLTVSGPGRRVLAEEVGWEIPAEPANAREQIREFLHAGNSDLYYFDVNDVGALIASGSVKTDGMIIIPCSMSTVSAVANGTASNLIERAADVMLKEKRPLVLVPRETPLNAVHLKNMLELSRMGVHLVPAMPAFYHHPRTIDDLVNFLTGRVLDYFQIEHNLYQPWQG